MLLCAAFDLAECQLCEVEEAPRAAVSPGAAVRTFSWKELPCPRTLLKGATGVLATLEAFRGVSSGLDLHENVTGE